jgi:hypothetical protein
MIPTRAVERHASDCEGGEGPLCPVAGASRWTAQLSCRRRAAVLPRVVRELHQARAVTVHQPEPGVTAVVVGEAGEREPQRDDHGQPGWSSARSRANHVAIAAPMFAPICDGRDNPLHTKAAWWCVARTPHVRRI